MTPKQFDRMLALEDLALLRFAEATGFSYRAWLEPKERDEYNLLENIYDQEGYEGMPVQDGTCSDVEPEDNCGCCGCGGCGGCEKCQDFEQGDGESDCNGY